MFTDKKYFSDSSFLINIFLIIACLILYLVFPSENAVQKFTGQIFFLVLIPIGYIKIILHRNLSEFGLNLKNFKIGLFLGIFGLLIVLAGTYSAVNHTGLADSYKLPAYIVNNFWYFLLYELVFANISVICFEFFLRGFALFSLAEKFSYWAILFQSILYLFLMISLKNPPIQMLYGFLISVLLGLISWRTKSIVYSYAIILISSIVIDAYLIHTIK